MQTSRQPQQGDQVENFSSYQTHAKSPPSYQQCMMMLSPPGAQIEEEDDDNFSNHSRTCQQAIALFLLFFLLLLIFCWIALLLDGNQEYKDSHNYPSTIISAPSFKAIHQYQCDLLTPTISEQNDEVI